MNNMGYKKIFYDGLWHKNQALVALLGLCPLLAVTTTAINGLGLGMATTLVLILSNGSISLIRNIVKKEIRLPIFVLIIASFVTIVELSMQAWFFELYLVLGIFIPLIVTNCAIIGRAEAFAAKNKFSYAIADGLAMGLGFTLALVMLGSAREIIGLGTLFAQADLMFGDIAANATIVFNKDYQGMLIAILPPGAFMGLGFMIALKNGIDKASEARVNTAQDIALTPAPET